VINDTLIHVYGPFVFPINQLMAPEHRRDAYYTYIKIICSLMEYSSAIEAA